MRRHWSLYLLAFALLSGSLAWPAVSREIRPLVELSRPTAVGSCDHGSHPFGDWPIEEAQEPIVAVIPIHPNNVVTAWIQGPFQDIIAAVSLDWRPNLAACSNPTYDLLRRAFPRRGRSVALVRAKWRPLCGRWSAKYRNRGH